jgi:methyl-accepting chemotaxis protein
MRSWTISRQIVAGFALAVVILVVVGVVGYRSTDALIANDRRVERSHVILETMARVLSVMKDAETGQRGYVISGVDSYLEPYRAATTELRDTLAELKRVAADNPRQQERAEHVATLANDKMTELAVVIDLRRTKGFDEAQKEVLTDRGKRAMDQLREVVGAMEHDERDTLKDRAAAAEGSAASAKSTILVAALLALVFVAGAGAFITRAMNQRLGSAIANIRSCSAELEAAATQQVTGAREQATATSEVSTTIMELLSTSRQIAESAQRVTRIAEETAAGARSGDLTVQRSQEALSTIKRQVDLIVTHSLDLGKKSQQAGGILEIINELAEQTNILAINATIEAAGAGESGRRFAVVADEIRKLADRVGGSTKEIRAVIEDIRSSVNTTVMATESGTKAVDAGTKQFLEVTSAFKQIAGLVVTTTEASREIELSTKQQASAVEQINSAIGNVALTTNEGETSSRQTLQTATELTGLSQVLSRLIEAGASG